MTHRILAALALAVLVAACGPRGPSFQGSDVTGGTFPAAIFRTFLESVLPAPKTPTLTTPTAPTVPGTTTPPVTETSPTTPSTATTPVPTPTPVPTAAPPATTTTPPTTTVGSRPACCSITPIIPVVVVLP